MLPKENVEHISRISYAMENNLAIRVGSIVTLKSTLIDSKMCHIGKVLRMNIWDGIRGVEIMIPGKHTLKISLERCYNATEKERKTYFKDVLKYEN